MLSSAAVDSTHHNTPAPSAVADHTQESADGQWHRRLRLNVDYRHAAGSTETVSYVDVLSGATPLSRLQGKIVLIGATAAGLGDRVHTPVSPPGVGSPSTAVIAQI